MNILQSLSNWFSKFFRKEATNFGFIHVDPRDTDWIAGAESGIPFEKNIEFSDWIPFEPDHNLQVLVSGGVRYETNACACFSAANILMMQGNWMLANNKLTPEEIQKLTDWKFIVNGKFSISPRFIALVSNNDPASGNSFVKVWDALRLKKDGSGFGVVPEAYCPKGTTINGFYDRSVLTPEVLQMGKNFLSIFQINYEFVYSGCAPKMGDLQYQLQQAPLQIAAPVCMGWSLNSPVPSCGICTSQHATSIVRIDSVITDFDSETLTDRKLALNYPITAALKGVLRKLQPIPVPPLPEHHLFLTNMQRGDNNNEVALMQDKLKILKDTNGNPYFPTDVATTVETGRGVYGKLTMAAVAKFQKDNGINPKEPGRYCYVQTRTALNSK